MTAVSVIIPTFNEENTIGSIVREIRALYPDFEVLVINDGSTDNTVEVATATGAKVYSHPYNIGNGASIKTGIRMARGKFLVFMDGDGQHDPKAIEAMLDHLPEFDMVVGRRRRREQASFFRGLGNRFLNWLATYVAKFPVKDLTSGFRAIKAEIARDFISLLPNTYSYPTTITLSVLRDGRSLKYIPIHTKTRLAGKSGIRLIRDGLKFIMIITKICTLYSPLRIFLPVSAGLFLLGWVYYLYTYITAGRFTNMSALLFTTSIIIFMMGLVSEQVSQVRFDRDSTAPKGFTNL
jgi:glycosyltransferase involved in cell wall biosynthesis